MRIEKDNLTMKSTNFDFYVIDTILDYVNAYGTCQIEFDVAKLRNEVANEYANLIDESDEHSLKAYVDRFNQAFSRWDDVISTNIESSGHATIFNKEVEINDSQLSKSANDFINRFIIAILETKFGSNLHIIGAE